MKNIYLTLLLGFLVNSLAQQTPAPAQTETYSIVDGTAHIGNGKVIENSLIVFSKGKLTYVGKNKNKEQKGIIINAKNKHIYPGFIAVNSSLGLVEVDAVRATRDVDEVGAILPHIRSLIAYNTESKVTESLRPNGVFTVQVTPRGGTVSGTSSIVQIDAWNWEDAVIKKDDAIHLDWINEYQIKSYHTNSKNYNYKPNKKYDEQVNALKLFFTRAKNHLIKENTKTNLPFEATKGLFDGSQKLFIHVYGEKSIKDAIEIFVDLGVKKIVIVNGYEAEKVSTLLKKHNIPVILERPHRLPETTDSPIDNPYMIAKKLTDLNILIGLGMEGEMERMQTRNLPFYAGTYSKYGLSKEQALQLITGNNAKILGIDDKTGTLSVGKDATLFISKGDALDMKTNILNHGFIQGRKISLETHQTRLYKKYTQKYKGQ